MEYVMSKMQLKISVSQTFYFLSNLHVEKLKFTNNFTKENFSLTHNFLETN